MHVNFTWMGVPFHMNMKATSFFFIKLVSFQRMYDKFICMFLSNFPYYVSYNKLRLPIFKETVRVNMFNVINLLQHRYLLFKLLAQALSFIFIYERTPLIYFRLKCTLFQQTLRCST